MNEFGMIIINYNQPELTDDLLVDIRSQDVSFDLTVLDNGSDQPYMKASQRNVKNEDLNRVWNKFHEESNHKYQCFLNNDTRITKNFVSDTIKVFEKEPAVGIVVHITNDPNFCRPSELNYKILDNPSYQGWDFTIRRDLYKSIPESLRVFGGDTYLFSWILKQGFKFAVLYSSPIIHYRSKTVRARDDYKELSIQDQTKYDEIRVIEKLGSLLPLNVARGIGNHLPPADMLLPQMGYRELIDKDLRFYQEMLTKLRCNQSFAYTRWGDGEWFAIEKRQGYNCDKCNYYPSLGIALEKIVEEKQDYYMGRGKDKNLYSAASKYQQDWQSAEVFIDADYVGKLDLFIDVLKTKHVVYIGNKDLKKLPFIDEFIEIPQANVWNFKDSIMSKIRATMTDDHKIYLFSAGMASNVFIHELWKNNDWNTYIDVGSVFDRYVGKTTRSYQKLMPEIKELK